MRVVDPIKFKNLLWPNVKFYKEQVEMIYSVCYNEQTFVPAGNKLGKDFTAGFIILYFFLTRHPCRIVTTSAKDDHLRVLWGEIGNYLQTAAYPLDAKSGGPLIANQRELRKVVKGQECKISYVKGMVASPDSMAAMQGHHVAKTGDGIPRTLFVSDECSSVPDDYFRMAKTWMNRFLGIGNTWPCENFWKHGIEGKPGTDDVGGDIPRENGNGYIRKIIRITAEDSPNVRLGMAQKKAGKVPTNEMLVHGVKDYEEYASEQKLWDEVQLCVSHYARFWKGKDVMLYPVEWINRAMRMALGLKGKVRTAKAIGIDPAQGGDSTSMTAVDEFGVIEMISKKTPDTSVISGEAIAFMLKHKVEPSNVIFDEGGGGKQIADLLRAKGYKVRTVPFGGSPTLDIKRGIYPLEDRREVKEDRYVYVNKRAEMYHELRLLLDPEGDPMTSTKQTFAIGKEWNELIRQMGPIPLQYDGEGRLKLPPKNKPKPDSDVVSLSDLLGCSPDELDSLVLAVHGMLHKKKLVKVGAVA